MNRKYRFRVRWTAEAIIEVRAKSLREAEHKAWEKGLPWKEGHEADDGEGYSCVHWPPQKDKVRP